MRAYLRRGALALGSGREQRLRLEVGHLLELAEPSLDLTGFPVVIVWDLLAPP